MKKQNCFLGGTMKRLTLTFLVFGLFGYMLSAAITAQFTPSSIDVNVLNTTSFDPDSPHSQPIMAQLIVRNTDLETRFDLRVIVKWNGAEILSAYMRSREPIAEGGQLVLTNRDFLHTGTNELFSRMPGFTNSMAMEDILNHSPVLKGAVMAGYFPDGTLLQEVSVKTIDETNWSTPTSFSIIIRNASSIFLAHPGVPIGSNPTTMSTKPLTFMWNSTATGFNEFSIMIKQFAPNSPPTSSNVNNTGTIFYQSNNVSGGTFSEFLPFMDNNFYAWRISTGVYNEAAPAGSRYPAGTAHSNWFVFKFSSDTSQGSGQDTAQELLGLLNMLNNSFLQSLLSNFSLTGTIILDGQVYTGQDALNLIKELQGKELTIQVN